MTGSCLWLLLTPTSFDQVFNGSEMCFGIDRRYLFRRVNWNGLHKWLKINHSIPKDFGHVYEFRLICQIESHCNEAHFRKGKMKPFRCWRKRQEVRRILMIGENKRLMSHLKYQKIWCCSFNRGNRWLMYWTVEFEEKVLWWSACPLLSCWGCGDTSISWIVRCAYISLGSRMKWLVPVGDYLFRRLVLVQTKTGKLFPSEYNLY